MLQRVGPVVASVAIVAVLLLVLPGDDDDPATDEPAPTEAFLEAYERSRMVEVVVESVFTRTFADGRELGYDQRLVQRPPDDRLVVGAGTASGRVNGQVVRCNVDASAGSTCIQGGEAVPYEEEVAEEVAELARLVDPEEGAYDVDRDDEGCYELTLLLQILTPPYGVSSTFCFDEPSGALEVLDVRRPDDVTDRTEATEIRTEVTAADLRADDLGDPIATG